MSNCDAIYQNENIFNTRITDSKTYFKELFYRQVEENKSFANRKTGFPNIDENQIFNSGLYVIGGTPAIGKTTFCWQLLDQLAQSGEDCIYCTYKMSKLELYSKTVARKLFQDRNLTVSAADIRNGTWAGVLDTVIEELQETQGITMIELTTETVDDLIKLLTPIVEKSDKPPVVCIDYLQIMPLTKDNEKNSIDDTLYKLKLFQRSTNTTFIVVSSFNRTNYYKTVSFESFKESGGIEYIADIIWALQLNCLNNLNNVKDVEVRTFANIANQIPKREIQLRCLKCPNGSNYNVYFKYYSACDYFEPCDESDFEYDTAYSLENL